MKDRDNSAAALRQMSNEQLTASMRDACMTLFKLRAQSQTDRLDAPTEIVRNRRLIARIKTIQTERLKVAASK